MIRTFIRACLVTLVPVTASAVDIRLVPVAGTGRIEINASNSMDTAVIMDPGESVRIDVILADWVWDGARAYQVEGRVSSLTSGDQGSLWVQPLDVDADGACDLPAALCPRCGGWPDGDGLFVDTCLWRCNDENGPLCNPMDVTTCPGQGGVVACVLGFPEFFGNLPPLFGIGGAAFDNPSELFLVWAPYTAAGAADDGRAHYAGSFVLTASPDARGTFALTQWPSPCAECNRNGSFVRFEPEIEFPGVILGQARIRIRAGACCLGATCVPDLTIAECEAQGDTFWGDGTTCATINCTCTTDADCDDNELCTVNYCDGGLCVLEPLIYADVNNDGFVNVLDVLCIQETFGGHLPSIACAEGARAGNPQVNCQRKDIMPCPTNGSAGGVPTCSMPDETPDNLLDNQGDGFVGSDDLLAVLDTFAGYSMTPSTQCAALCP